MVHFIIIAVNGLSAFSRFPKCIDINRFRNNISLNHSIYQYVCILDENWDDDQLHGFEPCNENFVTGCNIINGKCECDTIRTCNSPFEFPNRDSCLTALRRIEGKTLFFY